MPDTIDVYNAIGTKFAASSNSQSSDNSRWEFQYDQNKNQVNMNVYLDSQSAFVMGGCSSLLTSSLNKNDVSQIIQWLFKVKSCLKDE